MEIFTSFANIIFASIVALNTVVAPQQIIGKSDAPTVIVVASTPPQASATPAPTATAKPFQKVEAKGLSNATKGWYFNRNKEHLPPTAQRDIDLTKYNAYYLGNTKEKVLYLTFDEGYENGYTSAILDTLKEKNVKAAFFVTKPYIKSEQDLVKRMVDEGHLVCNHSVTHKSFPDLSDKQIENELTQNAAYFKEIVGVDMPNFFRPPMGEYSERTLATTNNLGYKTIFWSFAYKDWLVDAQPGKKAAYDSVINNLHNGAIILLHAVSSSNTEALPDIIDKAIADGYTFESLENLEKLEKLEKLENTN